MVIFLDNQNRVKHSRLFLVLFSHVEVHPEIVREASSK